MLEIPDGMKTSHDDIILRALSELAANGIRHGRSTAFFLKLQLENDIMQILFQDNGIGCQNITPGFGLRNMKKGIEDAGGSINFRSEKDEGFETEIELPLRRLENVQN
jgi:signal transduction histidine kinase